MPTCAGHGVSYLTQLYCLFNLYFRLTIKNVAKLLIMGPLWWESTGGQWIPTNKQCRKRYGKIDQHQKYGTTRTQCVLFSISIVKLRWVKQLWISSAHLKRFLFIYKNLWPEASIKCRNKYLHPTYDVGFNFLSLPLIPASGSWYLNQNGEPTAMQLNDFPLIYDPQLMINYDTTGIQFLITVQSLQKEILIKSYSVLPWKWHLYS